jgi:8-oxo-dGTP pyrophosphatase MutT (NUDIX family)/GNAT superfamily N-acetyltransferase
MITYRKANPEDIRPALSLVEKVWKDVVMLEMHNDEREAYNSIVSEEKNEERVNQYISGKRLMDIAVNGDKIIGMVGVDSEGYIRQLFVDKDFHRQGIATELLHRMVCKLAIQGFNIIKLNSSRYALPFYQNFGFVQTGSEQKHERGFVYIPMEYKPNEIWDVLDADGNKTGRYHERGRKIVLGDYWVVVHVWKRNAKGEWLIDKRAPRYGRGDLDGKWETTGGCAIAGDDSLTAAIRETKEELGIILVPEKGTLFNRTARRGDDGHTWFEDVWIFEYNKPLESVDFDESEVSEVMWATTDKIREMMATGDFLGEEIYPYFEKMIEKWG